MNFEQIKNDEQKYMMNAYGRFNTALVKGKGATAWDCEGKEYIDFTSGIGVNSLGYCDDGWTKAVSDQAASLQHISNLYYSPLQTEVAKKLCELSGMDKVFLCNSGAEANECAIKIARKYSFDKYGEGRQKIVTLVNSFHGRTVTTLAATGQDVFHNFFFPFTEGFDYAKANDTDDLKSKLTDDHIGDCGNIPAGVGFAPAISLGGRTKEMMMRLQERLAGNRFLRGVIVPGTHGTTFGGNPVACAAAVEVLSRVAQPGFLKEVNEKGEYIRAELLKMPNVSEVRGQGLMIGIVTEKDNAKQVAARCVENGLLILTAKNLLRLLPPLTISYDEINKGLTILKNTMEETL